MNTSACRLTAALAGTCVLASAVLAQAQIPEGYEVVVLAKELGSHQRPGINNRSDVVWSSSFCPPSSNVFLHSGGRIQQITDGLLNERWPDMSNVGTIAWQRSVRCGPPYDLVVFEGGIAAALPGAPSIFSIPALNDHGEIVWSHDFSGEGLDVQLFRYDGESIDQVTNNGLSNQSARMNNHGDIAWVRYNFFASPWTSTVMLDQAGKTLELTDGMGQPQGADINELSQVVWGEWAGSYDVIKMWDNGQVVTAIENGWNPRINDKADISFGRG